MGAENKELSVIRSMLLSFPFHVRSISITIRISNIIFLIEKDAKIYHQGVEYHIYDGIYLCHCHYEPLGKYI